MNGNIIIYDWAEAINSKWPLEGVMNRILAIGAPAVVSFWLMKLLDKPIRTIRTFTSLHMTLFSFDFSFIKALDIMLILHFVV